VQKKKVIGIGNPTHTAYIKKVITHGRGAVNLPKYREGDGR